MTLTTPLLLTPTQINSIYGYQEATVTTPTISAYELGYSADTKTFYAEASELPDPAHRHDAYGIKGETQTVRFEYTGTEYDAEGEKVDDRYESLDGYTLVVFND